MNLQHFLARRTAGAAFGGVRRARMYSGAARFPESSEPKKDVPSEKNADEMTEEEKREAARELARQSFRDIGTMFSSGDKDKEVEPIDTRPIFENPEKFPHLSLLHQGQVLNELQDKFDKSWKKLSDQDKKLALYISYGNWGPREKFDGWNDSSSVPPDLPFKVPSEISSGNPKNTAKISKLAEIDLAQTAVRKDQFDSRKMDPVTKFFIYFTVLIAVAGLYRDKFIGEAGKPVETVVVDPYEQERQRRKLEQELAEQEAKRKKWYFLWLK